MNSAPIHTFLPPAVRGALVAGILSSLCCAQEALPGPSQGQGGTPSPNKSGKGASKDPDAGTPLNIPLVEGNPGLFLKIPDLDSAGKLRSLFTIGEVSKLDERTVEIRESFFETYRDDQSRDFSIQLSAANLDIYTKVLVAKVPVTIWRQDFEVHGATMEFNTNTREGGLGGPVKMIIYNGIGASSEPHGGKSPPGAPEAPQSGKAPK